MIKKSFFVRVVSQFLCSTAAELETLFKMMKKRSRLAGWLALY